VLEISATWLAPWLIGLIGAVRTGLWMSIWQLTMLVAGTMVFFLAASEPSISVSGLVLGMMLSRLGLRGFELSTQIIVQQVGYMWHFFVPASRILNLLQGVEAESRGSFSSVEAAYQSLFEMLSYDLTLMFSRPDQFRWPVLIFNVAVALACSTYATFVYLRKRNWSEEI
jgi:iron-regulated transporter 1